MLADLMPPEYAELSAAELSDRITRRRDELGDELVILAHHYQRDEVFRFGQFTGDSLKLARDAARTPARYIVFCGVHFMAESADILTTDEQTVCLPNLRAGCAMAEMATEPAVSAALAELGRLSDERIIPVAYVNSTAAVKAVTAAAGGSCCTSSNVRNVFDWALRPSDQGGAGGGKIFAVPDQHLARNTAVAMGYDESACAVYDPSQPDGGLSGEQVARATFILWAGHCYVHQFFRVEQIRAFRQADPEVKVIVHPECPREVVAEADAAGSTSQILETVRSAPPGSRWAIGTEENMVRRLAAELPDRSIRLISEPARTPCVCVQMSRIDLPHLLWTLDAIAAGSPVNTVHVSPETARAARVALERMLEIKPTRGVQ